MEQSKELQTILTELAKADERGSTVRVAEILGEQDVASTGGSETAAVGAIEGQLASAPTPSEEEPEEDQEPTPQMDEALSILGDLIRLQESSDG